MEQSSKNTEWLVYMIQSQKDESLYIGITNNLDKRIAAHNNGTGAKRTKNRGPWVLVWKSEPLENRSEASKKEYEMKKLSRVDKLGLINK